MRQSADFLLGREIQGVCSLRTGLSDQVGPFGDTRTSERDPRGSRRAPCNGEERNQLLHLLCMAGACVCACNGQLDGTWNQTAPRSAKAIHVDVDFISTRMLATAQSIGVLFVGTRMHECMPIYASPKDSLRAPCLYEVSNTIVPWGSCFTCHVAAHVMLSQSRSQSQSQRDVMLTHVLSSGAVGRHLCFDTAQGCNLKPLPASKTSY